MNTPDNQKMHHKDFHSPGVDARESWRILRIMAEFVSSAERLSCVGSAVSIFGSARTNPEHPNYQLTQEIARILSNAGMNVVSGGGPGIMEAANKGAFGGKGLSIGLNIQLPQEQHSNPYQDISQTFKHFFARKYMFVRLALAYVAMPGGFGTLDELLEALTLIQTEKCRRIPVILVGSEFWGGLLEWFRQRLVAENMISPEDMDLITVTDSADEVLHIITQHYASRDPYPLPEEKDKLFNL